VRVERLADIDNTGDLDGLAALISACDAVLTVSNTTAHLAGAVGTPTWVIVPCGRGHLWVWFEGQPSSPWYPRLQVRRQSEGQSWASLVEEIAPELVDAVAPHRGR
jgi:ADP-heptose:LPS heptosyltransferase